MMFDIVFTNVPCGGFCDEIEEWAKLDDDDDSIEFPCDNCEYEDYYQRLPMTKKGAWK